MNGIGLRILILICGLMFVENPIMSLTSIYGVKYIFRSDNEIDKLYGFHGDIISVDEFEIEPQERSDKN